MWILAIESSHDDTSVCLIQGRHILYDKTYTQTQFHKKFGGTVPEYAARGHVANLGLILDDLLQLEFDWSNLDHIAYTNEPGLIGSLQMGRLFAEAIGFALNKPARAINHMYGHIYAICFEKDIVYPALSLIVSGGHTQLWWVKNPFNIKLLGQTKDDAAGEVFDKVARQLKIGFPGGPVIEQEAQKGHLTFDFNLRMTNDYSFSFSGLKTKVINTIHQLEQKQKEIPIHDLAHSFQKAIVKNLIDKTVLAIKDYQPQSIILGGGVAANTYLRHEFSQIHKHALIPSRKFTTDNALMIGMRSYIEVTEGEKWEFD